jgi:16S rRNA (guanine527-N7)-methyltransferase
MADDEQLLDVLAGLRDHGALGEASLSAAVEHAEAFLPALPPGCRRVLDLGSGGGLPALVLASRLDDVEFVLTDRRERRTDLLRVAVVSLGLAERVTVLTGDVVRLARTAELARSFDAVTARAFGDPLWTLRCALPFLVDGGIVVVSEPPQEDGSRWPTAAVSDLGYEVVADQVPRVKRFRLRTS